LGYELGYLVVVELLDVLLGWADRVEAELVGVSACSGEVWRDGDGKDFAMGKVDELGGDGGNGKAELCVDVIEGRYAGEAVTVVGIGTVCCAERVGLLGGIGGEGKGVVDVGSEVGGVADGHEDEWEDEPGHLGTLLGSLGSETVFSGGEPEQPESERVELVVGGPTVDAVFVEALADESVDEVV
jgi:hypothetical protein